MAGKDFQLIFKIGAKLASNFTGSFTSASNKLKELENRSKIASKNMDGFKAAAMGAAKATALIGAGAAVAVNKAIGFENSMLGVAKQMDGARDSAGNLTADFYAMQKEILVAARDLPIATEEFAKMNGEALKMGVSKDEVIGFSKEVVKMATAFELPADQLAQDMGKIANMYKIPITNINQLADTINYLDDNALSAGGDIIEFMNKVGGTAAMVKISDKEVAALGSTLLTLGERTDTAGTAINAVFSKLGAANTGSKPFRAMVKEIGLSTTQLENMMQKDAVGAINTVMDAISKLPKDITEGQTSQIDAVSTLFGQEHWDTFSKLLQNREELNKQMDMATDGKAAGSMDKEYAARMATTQAQMEAFKNKVDEIFIRVGAAILPTLNIIMESVGKVVTLMTDWAEKNPVLFKTLIVIAGVITTVVAALGALAIGIYALAGPVTTAITIVKAFGTAFAWVSRIFMISPIGLILTAIALAIYLVYSNWSTIGPYLVDVWNSVKYGVQMAWDSIKAFFSSGIANISATIINWSPMGLFYKAFAAVMSWFGVSLPSKFTDFGRMIIQGLINGITSMAGAVMAKAKAIADKITSTVKGAFNIHSPSRVFAEMGKYNMLGLAQGMDKTASVPQRSALNAARETVPDLSGRLGSGNTGRSYGGGGINVTQHITVQGGGSDVYAQAKKGAASGAEDLKRQLKSLQNYESRVSYG